MPIRKTSKGYYWGDKGPFTTKEKAEAVERAAYANGYREPTATKDNNAERAGRQVARDIEYDDKRSGTREPARMRDAKAERAGRTVTRDIEYDMKRRRR